MYKGEALLRMVPHATTGLAGCQEIRQPDPLLLLHFRPAQRYHAGQLSIQAFRIGVILEKPLAAFATSHEL